MLFIKNEQITIQGIEHNTTHNAMELMAVIKSIEYLKAKQIVCETLNIYTDSQYVVNLQGRKERLQGKNYITNKGAAIQNSALVQTLITLIETNNINFVKVVAHQKQTEAINYNREVDKIVRALLRSAVASKT